MKIFKTILLLVYIIIEILATIFYLNKEMSAKVFFLIAVSMSMVIGLYFLDKHKMKSK